MAGKIMSLWIYSSILEVSWEGSAVLTGCLCMARGSGDLVQLGKGTLFASLGKGCSSIAWEWDHPCLGMGFWCCLGYAAGAGVL